MASRASGSLFPLGRTIPELLGQWMPSPENQECEGGPHRVPAKDPGPGEPAEAPLRQDRREHHERELEQEKRERRAHHQAGLARRRMYHAYRDDPVCQTENEVQRGEPRYAAEYGKGSKRLSHSSIDHRDPRPNAGAHNGAEDDALAERAVRSRRHAQPLRPHAGWQAVPVPTVSAASGLSSSRQGTTTLPRRADSGRTSRPAGSR